MVTALFRGSKPAPAAPSSGRGARGRHWILAAAATALLAAGPARAAVPGASLEGPDIVIIAEEERTIYEFRQGDQLRMVRVEPNFGKPYYLVPRDQTRGFGDLERADMLLPSWVIIEF
jgi:hypothetical protein